MKPQLKNLLSKEKSLYLQQHKDNPIHWLPYNQQTLELARTLNRPIFLSIGYSSCHWCHVMAHESFEDATTANAINELFINVKVDREEMPDVDQYYQKMAQSLGRNGGWPLSVFLLPDQTPLFVGTYFPKVARNNMPSFLQVAQEIHKLSVDRPSEVLTNADQLLDHLKLRPKVPDDIKAMKNFPAPSNILKALEQHFDKERGGLGKAPKFPHFAFFEWYTEQMLEGMVDNAFKDQLFLSVYSMIGGGLYDHLRGGIHRYSTDENYLVPHFEKMLYDQAGLISLMSKFIHLSPTPLAFDSLYFTLDYLEKEMLGEKSFFSAQDADSEGHEGLYFTFSQEEIHQVMEQEEVFGKNSEKIAFWMDVLSITQAGNFEDGLNVISLHPRHHPKIFNQEKWEEWRKLQQALLQERKMRIPPATDNKGIASWNFLLLRSLLDVLQYCFVQEIHAKAKNLSEKSLAVILNTFAPEREAFPIITHSTTLEKNILFFEDYAYYSEMILRAYEMTSDHRFKDHLRLVIEGVLERFLNDEGDAFLTREKASSKNERSFENLSVETFDSSYKSCSATFLWVLRRAAVLFSDYSLIEKTAKAFKLLQDESLLYPFGCGEALRALTYPMEVMRVVKVPKSFYGQEKYHRLISGLPMRFILDYNQEAEGDESWQICSLSACELQGTGLDELVKTFAPPK